MKKQPKRFDMNRKPNKPKWYLKIAEYVAAPFYMMMNKGHIKTDKAVKKLKGPYLILSTHAAFMDFAMIAKGIMPRTTGWVMSVEEYRRGNWLMYGIGGIPKRKFSHGISTAKHMLDYIKKQKHSVALFPEARFSLAGVNEKLDGALGKFCKLADVPVVMCMMNGNFLNSPQWCKRPYKGIRQEGHLYVLLTAEQVKSMPADKIQAVIEQAFVHDEYKWQVEKGYHIKSKVRAQGIHKILYKCPVCGKEFEMESKGVSLWCKACGSKWEMDTLSRLRGVNHDGGFSHVPDWYNWEREEVRKQVQSGEYYFQDTVRVEDFYSPKVGFVNLGTVNMTHDKNGFTFSGTLSDGSAFNMNKPVSSMYSVHIEYDFLNRGDAFEVNDDVTSYFMFLQTAKNYLTKLHFAVEELYDFYVRK